jgi:hypothetical protein
MMNSRQAFIALMFVLYFVATMASFLWALFAGNLVLAGELVFFWIVAFEVVLLLFRSRIKKWVTKS